jgi:hypothetical protein
MIEHMGKWFQCKKTICLSVQIFLSNLKQSIVFDSNKDDKRDSCSSSNWNKERCYCRDLIQIPLIQLPISATTKDLEEDKLKKFRNTVFMLIVSVIEYDSLIWIHPKDKEIMVGWMVHYQLYILIYLVSFYLFCIIPNM